MLSKKTRIVLGIILGAFGIAVATLALVLLLTRIRVNNCEQAAAPQNLYIKRVNDNKDLEISWYEPWPNFECNVIYILTYWINNGEKVELNASGDSFTIPSFSLEVCSGVTVELRALSELGILNEYNTTNTYTEFPKDVAVTDIRFTEADTGLLVTWARPLGTDACYINYDVYVITDLDVSSTPVDTERLRVAYDLFCFTVNIVILTKLNGQTIAFDYGVYEEEIIQQINFTISSEETQELITSWNNHYKYELCKLDYHVVYSSVGINDQSSNVTKPEARFNFEYCADANVTIQTYALERKIEGPAEIAAVQEISFGKTSNDMLAVSWFPVAYLSHCDIIYSANAENPATGEKYSCVGTTGCSIVLGDFCPNTEIIIRASSLNGHVIIGKPEMATYTC